MSETTAARAFDMVSSIGSGETMTSVAVRHGVSRERVRQIAEVYGVRRGGSVVNPHAIMAAIRSPVPTSMEAVASAAMISPRAVEGFLEATGRRVSVFRLLAWRRKSNTRARLIARMQTIGERLGRTPGAADLKQFGGGTTGYARVFGSVRNAQTAAGFVPRKVGRPRKETEAKP